MDKRFRQSTRLQELVARFIEAEWDSDAKEAAARALWDEMDGAERESLHQLLFAVAPIWDGDHISKWGRDVLLGANLAVRCCCKGEQGYTVATYAAYTLYRMVGGVEGLKEGQQLARERERLRAQQLIARSKKSVRFRWPWSGVRSLNGALRS